MTSTRSKTKRTVPDTYVRQRIVPNGSLQKGASPKDGEKSTKDKPFEYEFGGPLGVSALMVVFPLIMWYMWLCAYKYDGLLALPTKGENIGRFVVRILREAYEAAPPTKQGFTILYTFLVYEMILYVVLPGIYVKGEPLAEYGGKQLDYFCNGVWSLWVTIATAAILHVTGIFYLPTILEQFGPIMTAAIITGWVVPFPLYFYALLSGKAIRLSGNFIYDVFTGAILNPRIGIIDIKMFFEVRLPWYILMFLSFAAATKQYELYGYVTPQVAFCCMAHWLYANACSKGEECIVNTWDMAHEKFGFMLMFWNMAGVPFTYCHCTLYLAFHEPSVYKWSTRFNVTMFIIYLCAYYVFDTCNSQKNRFRQQILGKLTERKTFPQLPWQTIKNPTYIKCKNGSTLVTSGWYKYARKIHYTADFIQALSWALITGFNSPLPYFYPTFFFLMILHRTRRDILKCRKKYGSDWDEYVRQCPYLFIPFVF